MIIAGFGRFGQIVGRLLHANGIDATVLEHDPNHIETLRRFHFKVFYGDACRLDLLRTAGAENARVLVVAIDDREGVLKLVELATREFPESQGRHARLGRDPHVFELLEQGADIYERETFEGALRLGERVLKQLGFTAWRARQAAHRFRAYDEETLQELYRHYHEDMDVRARIAADARERMREIMQADEDRLTERSDGDWQQEAPARPNLPQE